MIGRAGWVILGAAALLPPGKGMAAPGSPFPLRHYTCTLGGPACQRLPKTWSTQGPGGKSGGTNVIESVDLNYHYAFKAGVVVYSSPAGEPKQCEMKWSQHLDVSGASDMGFFHASGVQTVTTAPLGAPMNNKPLYDFHGNVSAHLTDAKKLAGWYGSGPVSFANVVDLYPSQSADKLACTWGYVDSRSIDGTVTINYRAVVLYATLGKPGAGATLPPH